MKKKPKQAATAARTMKTHMATSPSGKKSAPDMKMGKKAIKPC